MSQPQVLQGNVVFLLRSNAMKSVVVRQNREAQKLDILFLCVGQRVILWGRIANGYVIAEKIRILDYKNRNYLLDFKQTGERNYGDPTYKGNDPGNS